MAMLPTGRAHAWWAPAAAGLLVSGTLVGLLVGRGGGGPEADVPDLSRFHPPAPGPGEAPETPVEALGRILFFDPRLSGDGRTSCSTCHDPARGYGDGRPTAVGAGGKILGRNSPTLIRLQGRAPYFWDGRAETLEAQALMPLENPDEMARDVFRLVGDLEGVPEYLARFARAFPGSPRISKETIAAALAAFERTLACGDSDFDRFLAGDRTALGREAIHGLRLFVGKAACATCHDGPDLTDNGFHNVGVGDGDEGRFRVVPVAAMKGAFRTPTLRGLAESGPYFHDGSASTLEAVIEHYDRGGGSGPGLDPQVRPLGLTREEKAALVALLRAMSGRTTIPAPTRIPRVPEAPPGATLLDLMLANQDRLDAIRGAIAGTGSGADPAALAHLRDLRTGAELARAVSEREVAADRRREFDLLLGHLILDLEALERALDSPARADDAAAIRKVETSCQACHTAFRPERSPR